MRRKKTRPSLAAHVENVVTAGAEELVDRFVFRGDFSNRAFYISAARCFVSTVLGAYEIGRPGVAATLSAFSNN